MAHFAELDENNIVRRVIVVANAEIVDANGVEQEAIGVAFCERLFGGRWVQTSYNNTFRKNYAGAGFTFDASRDAFIPPKPYASWVLDENTCRWKAPVDMPMTGLWLWDEATLQWKPDTVVPVEVFE